jgi:uncharacterized repeat protein (TIGR03803 family)
MFMNATRGALTLAVICALVLFAARPAWSQTETVLYNFTGGTDGGNPNGALTPDGAGNYYGAAAEGGIPCDQYVSCGTIFELSPNGSGGWNETVIHYFVGSVDGAFPAGSLIFDRAGNLYGTTTSYGVNGCGAVFELSPSETVWTETVLYSFACGADGAYPASGLIMDPAGNLYGVTGFGGTVGWGVVFELSPSGSGWTEQVIYNLQTQASTCSGVTMDASKNIFGLGDGGVFELSPNGNGGWNSAMIHIFSGPPKDGQYWLACGTPVLDKSGNLYGTTGAGGAKNWGAVYRLSPKKGKNKGKWAETILHSFTSGKEGKDGNTPEEGVVLDAAGNIYGTATTGGKSNVGAVFELVANGKGGYKEKLLWSFNDTDGNLPAGPLILDSAGTLYGPTYNGGLYEEGVVFEVTP